MRTLVLFPGALGDAVCVEPAVAYLAEAGPVTFYARGAAAEVAELFPARPEVRSLDRAEVARLFAPHGGGPCAEWLDPFARIVSFTGADVPALVARLTATGRAAVHRFPRPPLPCHAVDYFLRAVAGDGSPCANEPRLVLPDGDPHDWPQQASARLVLLPGSGAAAKRAAPELLVGLAARWRDRSGEVVVVLGPAEAADETDWLSLGRVERPPSIAALAALLAHSAAFVGNDSGPSHVAAALGVGGVVLFIATEPEHFGPRGRGVVAVRAASGLDAVWAALAGLFLDIP